MFWNYIETLSLRKGKIDMKWCKLGYDNYAYVDEKGRIVGEYLSSQIDGTSTAFYEGQKIGRYMTDDDAKEAIAEAYMNRILK